MVYPDHIVQSQHKVGPIGYRETILCCIQNDLLMELLLLVL